MGKPFFNISFIKSEDSFSHGKVAVTGLLLSLSALGAGSKRKGTRAQMTKTGRFKEAGFISHNSCWVIHWFIYLNNLFLLSETSECLSHSSHSEIVSIF